MSKASRQRFAIVGGGLAGWSLAWALTRPQGVAGEEGVVIDEGRGCRGSSSPATMFHAFPGRRMSCRRGLCGHYEVSWRQIEEWLDELGGTWCRQQPMVRPLEDDERGQRLKESWREGRDEYPSLLESELVESAELRERFEGVGWEGEALVYGPSAAVVMPELVERMAKVLVDDGVQEVDGRAVEVASDEGWKVVLDSGEEVGAEEVILSVGYGLAGWFPGLDLRQRAGEVALLSVPGESLGALVNARKHVFERPDGLWGIGSTYFGVEDWDNRHDGQVVEALLEGVRGAVPAVEEAEIVEVWRGIRSVFGSDHQPLVGDVPGNEGLRVFSAFGSKGLVWIPSTANGMARYLVDGEQEAIGKWMRSERMSADKWKSPRISPQS